MLYKNLPKKSPAWQYDEFNQVGVDYTDSKEVEAYDLRHAQFRDVDAECTKILGMLGVNPQSVVIELGTGTGAFAIQAARHCANVYAVDVSKPMLAFAQHKAEKAGIKNVTFCHAGFLTYEHKGALADALVTSMAFHHLPDFWKGIALERMNGMLRPNGLLYIHDVIFEQLGADINIQRWIDQLEKVGGKELRCEVEAHVKEEYSTFDWVMEGLLERTNFRMLSKEIIEGVIGTYLCKKKLKIDESFSGRS